ncbi:unnamed protein product [Lampetra fluviatilis]
MGARDGLNTEGAMEGSGDAEWVRVANELLKRCHVNLRVRRLAECDANVFVAIYEATLGEKVPDSIAVPKSKEDDAHNVQSIIDSLALDYLQISLSHITGENVVNGHKDSIRNLLEIFDGLVDYLSEQVDEDSSQHSDDDVLLSKEELAVVHDVLGEDLGPDRECGASRVEIGGAAIPEPAFTCSRAHQSANLSLPSWDVDGTESTAELIRLGETAHSFTVRAESQVPRINPLAPETWLHPRGRNQVPDTRTLPVPSRVRVRPGTGTGTRLRASCGRVWVRDQNPFATSALLAEGPPHKTEFSRTLPRGSFGLLFLPCWPNVSGRGENTHSFSPPNTTCRSTNHVVPICNMHKRRLFDGDALPVSETLSRRRAKNLESERELREMSDCLSHRLEQLDRALRMATGATRGRAGDPELPRGDEEEEVFSRHSDSAVDYSPARPVTAPRGGRSTIATATPRARPHSTSPPRKLSPRRLSPQGPPPLLEEVLQLARPAPMRRVRWELRQEGELQRLKAQVVKRAYEAELKDARVREGRRLETDRRKLTEMEDEYKENVRARVPLTPQARRVYAPRRAPGSAPTTPSRKHRLQPPVRVKENDLLPVLLAEFPHLHISPHTLNRMWRQQCQQMDRLTRIAARPDRSHAKLQGELEEAQRKHDLLVAIIKKEQEHNQRLREVRERVRQQKASESQRREQREQVARARHYYSRYHLQQRARMLRERTREERVFRQLFEEGLEVQKERLSELRSYARDKHDEQRQRQRDELQSVENYYKDQFSMLADTVSQERRDMQVREKAQGKAVHKLRRELRGKMERDIQELQELLAHDDAVAHFREVEADRVRRQLQVATFTYVQEHAAASPPP